MLVANKCQPVSASIPSQLLETAVCVPKPPRSDHSDLIAGWSTSLTEFPPGSVGFADPYVNVIPAVTSSIQPQKFDPLYLFACQVEWEQREEPSAGWELLRAARSANGETRAQARALLANSRHIAGLGTAPSSGCVPKQKRLFAKEETDMNAPYGLEIIDNCGECGHQCPTFFCGFSEAVLNSLNKVSHRSALPSGAILFVEGQTPRGVFILCSGTVNISTSSHEGKALILKSAEEGQALGLSAVVSGSGYEATAETASPCLVNFIERNHFLALAETHTEVGLHTAQSLSRDFQAAYHDIHDLVLTRSSAGKLARLLLSQSATEEDKDSLEVRIRGSMTHEEMGQRIGASRETVTRLLSNLKRKKLIRSDGPTLVIRDRSALKALAV